MTDFQNSDCEAHRDIKTSDPVCIVCLHDRISELEDDYAKLLKNSLQQAKLLIAQQKMLLDAGVECGSAATLQGMKEVESLIRQAANRVDA